MTFADPQRCPDCRGHLEGGPHCPTCGLDLTSDAARTLWQALQSADAWLVKAREHRVPLGPPQPVEDAPMYPQAPISVPDPMPAPEPAAPGPGPSAPIETDLVAAATAPPRRRLSVGTVLLALGALSLIVAGSIFITVYWDVMGLLGRALVLLAVTAVFGALAVWATRRGLRGSAEALWSVFLALLSLDWLAARSQGLLGLDDAPAAPVELSWAIVVVGLAVVAVRLGHRHLAGEDSSTSVTLVVPSVAAGLAATYAIVGRGPDLTEAGLELFWAVLAVALLLAAAALGLWRLALRIGALLMAVPTVGYGLVAIVISVDQAVTHPELHALAVRGEGVPLLVVVIATLGAAVVVRSRAVVVSALVAAATLLATLLLVLPVAAQWQAGGAVVVLALVLVGLVVTPAGAWGRGGRWAASVPAATLALVLLLRLGVFVGAVALALEDVGSASLLSPLEAPGEGGDAWLAAVAALALAAATLLLGRRVPVVAARAGHAATVAVVLLVAGAWATLASYEVPALVLALAVVAGGLAICLVPRPALDVRTVLGASVVAAAPLVAFESWVACLVVWPLAAVGLVVLSLRPAHPRWRDATAALAAWWAAASVVPLVEVLGHGPEVRAYGLLAAGLVLLGVAASWLTARSGRAGVEVAAAVGLLWSVGQGSAALAPEPFALLVLVLGGVVVGLSLVPGGHRWYGLAGSPFALLAVLTTIDRWDGALWVWPAAAVVVAVAAVRVGTGHARTGLAGVAALVAGSCVVPTCEVLGAGRTTLIVALLAAGLLLVAGALLALSRQAGGDGVEVAGAVLVVPALVGACVQLDLATVAVLFLVTAASAIGLGWFVERRRWYALVGASTAALVVLGTIESWPTAVWAWPVAGLVIGAAAVRVRPGWERSLVAGGSALALGASVVPAAEVRDLPVETWTLLVVVASCLVALVGLLLVGPTRGGDGVEVAGALLLGLGLVVSGVETGPGHVALLLTVTGVVAAAVSLLVRRRSWYRWVAVAALAVAYVLRLVASDVGVVEAYTLPFGAALLLLGGWVMVRPPAGRGELGSVVALGPGLLLVLAPSLPQALADPASLRALALGLGAFAVLVVGVLRRWKAPFLLGALVLGLVVLVNLGPLAWGLPRWVLIAAAGAIMLGAGVTWEKRVRDGRAVVHWVGTMR
ncbi:SCO7613 C-terminal domain-containing membrane protein [Aeromicrobium sp. CF4.19]|uniref:SCO7613 C-terminal domain-containing membrane protein n=1 Tax=Aeromicrobium sp. CF4.19 TaxID=3373082 RepID=UPI003EE75592